MKSFKSELSVEKKSVTDCIKQTCLKGTHQVTLLCLKMDAQRGNAAVRQHERVDFRREIQWRQRFVEVSFSAV